MNEKRRKPRVRARVIPCGVGIILRGRQVLIAQRNPDDSFGSFWEFPGGKKNSGETFEECVVRETKEELGIDVRVQRKFMEIRRRYDRNVIWLNFFVCSHVDGEPRAIDCQNVRWTELEELKNFKFPPTNERVIEGLIKEANS